MNSDMRFRSNELFYAEHLPCRFGRGRVGLLLFLAVLGIVLLQVVQRYSNRSPRHQRPGVGRGDFLISEDTLPEMFEGWTMVSFAPPLAEDVTPEGQFWSTHAWGYRGLNTEAIVAFDQLGWHTWHELSTCYLAIGWEFGSREIHGNRQWRFVISKFTKPPNQFGLLAFSLCTEEGTPLLPSDGVILGLEEQPEILNNLAARLNESTPTKGKVVQCQVFASGTGNMTQELIEMVRDLHLKTRDQLREEVLNQKQSTMLNQAD